MKDSRTGNRRSTLRDVALEAGVSVATVSRVLNGSALVTAETKARVGAAMESLAFAPSAAARSLNAGKTRTIGTLVPTIDHSIFARYLNSLEETLSARGYGLIVAVTGGDPEVEARKAHDLLSLGVDGLIVSGVAHTDEFDKAAARFGVPVVITSYFDETARYPTVGYDNAAIAAMAIRFLQSKGHRDIAVIHGPRAESDRTVARIDGAVSAAGPEKIHCIEADLSVAGGSAAMHRLLTQRTGAERGPTVALCLSDVQALGALFAAQKLGQRVPEDISIMGFDNLEWSDVSVPSLTTIELPAVEMGRASAEALVNRLTEGTEIAPANLSARIVERGSVADLSGGV